jgi:hypothetical protein
MRLYAGLLMIVSNKCLSFSRLFLKLGLSKLAGFHNKSLHIHYEQTKLLLRSIQTISNFNEDFYQTQVWQPSCPHQTRHPSFES